MITVSSHVSANVDSHGWYSALRRCDTSDSDEIVTCSYAVRGCTRRRDIAQSCSGKLGTMSGGVDPWRLVGARTGGISRSPEESATINISRTIDPFTGIKANPLIDIKGRTSTHIQLTFIPLNSNLTFGGVESGNPLPTSACVQELDNKEASHLPREKITLQRRGPNSIRPDTRFHHSSIHMGNIAHPGLDRAMLTPRPQRKCSLTLSNKNHS